MDITTLAAWGEFIGGIAVVVSLVYLASQIRQNSRLLRASTGAVTSQQLFTGNMALVQDREVMQMWTDGSRDRASLSECDQGRFNVLAFSYVWAIQQQHEFAGDALISPGVWETQARQFQSILQQPGIQQWWREFGKVYSNRFREFVDGLIREGEAAE